MDTTISSLQVTNSLTIPITFVFWGYVSAYALHIIEESVLSKPFVEKVKRNFWPEYSWNHFAGFNTLLMSLNILAIALYELLGGAWIIFPLSLAIERNLNGVWHLGETVLTKKFSSGLLTSILFWILGYFIIRYSILKGEIIGIYLIISIIIGVILTALMLGSLLSFRKKFVTSMSSD